MSTVQKKPTFLLVGNGSYFNRGCEAITLGTTNILRNTFGEAEFTSVSFGKIPYSSKNDPGVIHRTIQIGRYSRAWFVQNILQTIGLRKTWFPVIGSYMKDADMVLALGGDNYSMDYGSLRVHLAMIDYAAQHNRPFVIWGGSVGPFKKNGAEYEQYVAQKLKGVKAILAREGTTVDYLAQLGLSDNVHLVADPAFVMEPVEPPADTMPFEIPEGAIGLNFSPLMARYLSEGNIEACQELIIELVQNLLDKFEHPIILIPHVFFPVPKSDDHAFLSGVANAFAEHGAPVYVLPPSLSAPEIKWIISKLHCFAGARTHSTIAAISAGIPTLSFSYSIKSIGINRDVFGHKEYVLSPNDFSIDKVTNILDTLIRDNKAIRHHLDQQLPLIKQRAFKAGEYLKNAMYN